MSLAGKLTARRGVRQFVKFAIVGASGAVVSFLVFHLLIHFRLDLSLAFSIGFILGGVNNYWWNRLWTFRSTRRVGMELAQFLTVSAVALGLGFLITRELNTHLAAFP
ncbi:MAG: GtrA family protein [Candidatus Eremiobacteraeota bacterium]|nr:GtrA family protein [Candidatus Eremiobacteraeota bacterium]